MNMRNDRFRRLLNAAESGGVSGVTIDFDDTTYAEQTTASTSVTVDIPLNTAVGDIILLINGADTTNETLDQFSYPAGYVEIEQEGSASSDVWVGAAYRVVDGTEGATITVTNLTVAQLGVWAFRIQGADPVNPIEAIGTGISQFATANTVIPGVTVTTDNSYAFYGAVGDGGAAGKLSDVSGDWTVYGDVAILPGGSGLNLASGYLAVPTATDVADLTLTHTSYDTSAFMFAIRPDQETVFVNKHPTFANVEFLMNFNGADTTSTFTDLSANAHTITKLGTPTHSTDQTKFGTSSLLLDGTGDYFTLPAALDTAMAYNVDGSNLLTIEFWMYCTAFDELQCPFGTRDGSSGVDIYVNVNGDILATGYGLTAARFTCWSANDSVSINTWHHIAVEQSADTWTLYIDGRVADEQVTTANVALSGNPQVGNTSTNSTRDFIGHLDAIRVTQGELVYGGPFLVPTEAPEES